MQTSIGLIFLGLCMVIAATIMMSVRIYQIHSEFVIKFLKYTLVVAFWMIFSVGAISIGFRIQDRHVSSYSRGLKSVEEIWGGLVTQSPPTLTYPNTFIEEYENQKTGSMEKRQKTIYENIGFST